MGGPLRKQLIMVCERPCRETENMRNLLIRFVNPTCVCLSVCLLNPRSHIRVPMTTVTTTHSVTFTTKLLTFKNRASYIYRTGVPLPSRCCILYISSTTVSTEYFKHAAHSPLFSSKCRLFHNATFFGSCIIHILHTGCAKI